MPTEYISYLPFDQAVDRMKYAYSRDEYRPINIEANAALDGSNIKYDVTCLEFTGQYTQFVKKHYHRINSFSVYLKKIDEGTKVSIVPGAITWEAPLRLDRIFGFLGFASALSQLDSTPAAVFSFVFLGIASALLLKDNVILGIILAAVIILGWIQGIRKSTVTPWVQQWVREHLPPRTPPPQ